MADQGEGFSLPQVSFSIQAIERPVFVMGMYDRGSYNTGYADGFANGSLIAPFAADSSEVAITATNAAGPIPGLTPVFLGYYNAEANIAQPAPSITEVGQGNYKFTPTGDYPAGLIDLGSSAIPRYLVFATVSRFKVFGAFDIDRAPLAALSPVWLSLKKVSDGTDYLPQPTIEQVGFGLYRTGWTAEHTVGVIDLGSSAYPRYYQYDSEITAEFTYGYANGELYGFSSQRMENMQPIAPGETDPLKKTITFMVYTSSGLPASGNVGEGSVYTPAAGEIQVNKNLAGYLDATGTFAHIADGKYRYVFHDNEVSGSTEGYALFRLKADGFRVLTLEVPLRTAPADAASQAAIQTKLGTPAGASVSADIASVKSTVDSIQTTVTELHKIAVGRWKIVNNQLILYDTNGTTPLRTFDLLDDAQAPSMTKIFERLPVP